MILNDLINDPYRYNGDLMKCQDVNKITWDPNGTQGDIISLRLQLCFLQKEVRRLMYGIRQILS